MIIDAFTWYSELDMLEFRLRLLWNYVDCFVIVECDHTFSGKPKPWNLLDHKERFSWAWKKIVYHKFEAQNVWDGSNPPTHTDPSHPCWNIEYAQRNAIMDAVSGFKYDDILLISDCDEIPNPSVFPKIDNIRRWEPVALRQHFFYYNLSCLRREQWNGTIVTTVGTARKHTPQGLRAQRNTLQIFTEGGWHLSYMTDVKGIQEKLGSFSHVEYSGEKYTNEPHIQECIAQRKDLFVRGMVADKVGREFFPDDFLKQSDKFNWWGNQ